MRRLAWTVLRSAATLVAGFMGTCWVLASVPWPLGYVIAFGTLIGLNVSQVRR
jgi:hypothetical protein